MRKVVWVTLVALLCMCAPAQQSDTRNADDVDPLPIEDVAEASGETPPCALPLGAACNPIIIDRFPYEHRGDTSDTPESLINVYGCAPSADEGGPEVHYQIEMDEPGLIHATLEELEGVDVDVHLLRTADPDDCLTRGNTELEWPLPSGTHHLVVDTYRRDDNRAGEYTLRIEVEAPRPERLGMMWNTYYFLANEANHEGPQDVPIYDSECHELTRVREEFHDSLCLQGSGMLEDRRIVNVDGTCTDSCPAARRCGRRSYRICYRFLDAEVYPWGMGARQVRLVPDLSIAVDREFVPLGTVIYLEELDGITPPGTSAPHDGCVRADDVGGAIDGNHFDFFSGTRDRWRAWEALIPTRSEFTAWINHPRCYGRYEEDP